VGCARLARGHPRPVRLVVIEARIGRAPLPVYGSRRLAWHRPEGRVVVPPVSVELVVGGGWAVVGDVRRV